MSAAQPPAAAMTPVEIIRELESMFQKYPWLYGRAELALKGLTLEALPAPALERLMELVVAVLGNDPTTDSVSRRAGEMGDRGVLGAAMSIAHTLGGMSLGLGLDAEGAAELTKEWFFGDVQPSKDAGIDATRAHVQNHILPMILNLHKKAQLEGTTPIIIGLGNWPHEWARQGFDPTQIRGEWAHETSVDSHCGSFIHLYRFAGTNVVFVFCCYPHPGASGNGADKAKKPVYATFLRSALSFDVSSSGQEKGDSTSLQHECSARARSGNSSHASRALREMIARPKISRNEWKSTEIGAFEVGNFAPFPAQVELGALHHPVPRRPSPAPGSGARRAAGGAALAGAGAEAARLGVPRAARAERAASAEPRRPARGRGARGRGAQGRRRGARRGAAR